MSEDGYKKRRIMVLALVTIFIASHLMACGSEEEGERGEDWDYTVVPTADCPADFLSEINKKKINAFQMTYEDGEACYIAVGYGEQKTSGYSIQVLGLYEIGDDVCLETSLVGPGEDDIVNQKKSTPYIIIKTKKTERQIEFL